MEKLQTAINTLLSVKLEVIESPKVIGVINLLKEVQEELKDYEK